MPRGNDPTANTDLFDQYGVHGNAQELIMAHRASIDPAVSRASLLRLDEEATEEANDDLKGSGSKLGVADDETLVAVAVRGNALIGVVELPNGRTEKRVAGYNSKYQAPELSDADRRAREENSANAAAAAERAKIRQEVQDRVERERIQAEEWAQAEIAKIQEDAQERVAAAAAGDDPAELTVDESKKRIASMSKEQVAEARKAEEGRDSPRKGVLDALDAREAKLAKDEE